MKRILVCGSTGLVGQALCKKLLNLGYQVLTMDRLGGNRLPGIDPFYWDVEERRMDPEALWDLEAIINLSGTNIGAKRWSPAQRKQIRNSRVQSTQFLLDSCFKYHTLPKTYISASATGYYGTFNSERVLEEGMQAGRDFLAQVCAEWELHAKKFETLGTRVVMLRKGVVLGRAGGMYARLRPLVNAHINPQLGKGVNYLPWVHIEDVVNAYIKAIEDPDMHGPYNLCAPESIRMQAFCTELAHSLDKKIYTPALPEWLVKAMFGSLSQILLQGSQVSPKRIQKAGFEFRFPGIKAALKDLGKKV